MSNRERKLLFLRDEVRRGQYHPPSDAIATSMLQRIEEEAQLEREEYPRIYVSPLPPRLLMSARRIRDAQFHRRANRALLWVSVVIICVLIGQATYSLMR